MSEYRDGLKENEKVEVLSGGVEVIISPSHGFGTDAMLLADFASPRRKDLCMDFGTGCGIIPMLWFRNGVQKDIYGVDIQPLAVDQFTRSVDLTQKALATQNEPVNTTTSNNSTDHSKDANTHLDNRLSTDDCARLHPVLADLKDLPKDIPAGCFNVVTMNPPYKPEGDGILSETNADQIARHMTECTLEDMCRAAARLLNFGGKFCICLRPERLVDAMEAYRKAGLEPKKLRFVQKRADTPPWLFLLEGRKGGKPFLTVQPPLLIQGPDGRNSEELQRIIGEYANN